MPNTTKKASKRKSKGTTRKGGETCPIFLQKTYLMVDTCTPSIACWSEDTSTSSFVVKHPEQFASSIIPQYFKHSNFASFVRQLNFYGFRKIKSDPIKLSDSSEQKNYWYFQHDLFRKGRRDLLHQIRKANQGSVVPVQDQEDVTSLKQEVTSLQKQLSEMNGEMEKVTSLMQKLNPSSAAGQFRATHDNTSNTCSISSSSISNSGPIEIDENSSDLLDFSNVSDIDLLLEPGLKKALADDYADEEQADILTPLPSDLTRHSSFLSHAAPSDMEVDDSLLFTDLEHDTVALSPPCETTAATAKASVVSDNSTTSDSSNDTFASSNDFRQPLYDCLGALPTDVQESVVHGLATSITNPDFFHDHINLLSHLAKVMTDVLHLEKEEELKKSISKEETASPVTLETGLPTQPPVTASTSTPVMSEEDIENKKNSDLALNLVSTLMAAIITQPNSLPQCHKSTSDNANNTNRSSVPTSVPIQV